MSYFKIIIYFYFLHAFTFGIPLQNHKVSQIWHLNKVISPTPSPQFNKELILSEIILLKYLKLAECAVLKLVIPLIKLLLILHVLTTDSGNAIVVVN